MTIRGRTPGALVDQYFPPTDTLTLEQYRRLILDGPPAAPVSLTSRRRTERCAACDTPFVPVRRTSRFCSRTCRRWFHYGTGAKERKAVAS